MTISELSSVTAAAAGVAMLALMASTPLLLVFAQRRRVGAAPRVPAQRTASDTARSSAPAA